MLQLTSISRWALRVDFLPQKYSLCIHLNINCFEIKNNVIPVSLVNLTGVEIASDNESKSNLKIQNGHPCGHGALLQKPCKSLFEIIMFIKVEFCLIK